MSPVKVGFYGHVRQYHNLKAEIDAAILEVLESGSFVMGPKLKQFEKELADVLQHQGSGGRELRHGRSVAGVHGARHRARR